MPSTRVLTLVVASALFMESLVSTVIAGRFCQGLGGGMMLPVGRLILLRVIPKREMVSAMAWLSIPALMAGGAALLGLYLRHARRVAHAILDLQLLRIASFRITLLAGGLFRLSVGAIPFLLSLASVLMYRRLAPDAGAEVSGHGRGEVE